MVGVAVRVGVRVLVGDISLASVWAFRSAFIARQDIPGAVECRFGSRRFPNAAVWVGRIETPNACRAADSWAAIA